MPGTFISHAENHRSNRVGWLRAAVLGANDGLVSTASLIVGVSAASVTHSDILLVGVAGLVAGAMSMAAGEYVSVSSQADAEKADLEMEQRSLDERPGFEHRELAAIYRERGVDADLAKEVARQLMDHDALGAHARDEIGITDVGSAQPILAAVSSAAAFTVGALLPLFVAWLSPLSSVLFWVPVASLLFLALLGGIAASVGGAPVMKGALRVFFWGAMAMALTALVGKLFGVAV